MVEARDRFAVAARGECLAQRHPGAGAARSARDHARKHRLRPGSSRRGGAPLHALRARHGRKARRQIHRDVRERFYPRLRRGGTQCDPGIPPRGESARLHRQRADGGICGVTRAPKHQIPSSKLQRNIKLQLQKAEYEAALELGIWSFPGAWSLVFGISRQSAIPYFFGFDAGLPASLAKVFTRSNSFWNPLAKSWVPYSKRTTKQKVKKTKRTSQKSPRSSDINRW